MSRPLNLTAHELAHAKRLGVRACMLAYHNRGQIHYTQGPERWQGIDKHLRSFRGEFPTQADCSAFATWVLWDATLRFHPHDFVNGTQWRWGHTGTMAGDKVHHGKLIARGGDVRPEKLRILDLVFYGDEGWRPGHVAVYVGDGMVVSHGSESGPNFLPVRYRGDVHSARRYLA